MKIESKQLGVNLRVLMAERGLSIARMSELTGIPKSTIYSIRNEQAATIKITVINKLCEFLKVNLNQLFLKGENKNE